MPLFFRLAIELQVLGHKPLREVLEKRPFDVHHGLPFRDNVAQKGVQVTEIVYCREIP